MVRQGRQLAFVIGLIKNFIICTVQIHIQSMPLDHAMPPMITKTADTGASTLDKSCRPSLATASQSQALSRPDDTSSPPSTFDAPDPPPRGDSFGTDPQKIVAAGQLCNFVGHMPVLEPQTAVIPQCQFTYSYFCPWGPSLPRNSRRARVGVSRRAAGLCGDSVYPSWKRNSSSDSIFWRFSCRLWSCRCGFVGAFPQQLGLIYLRGHNN